jgi:hypothetical protein
MEGRKYFGLRLGILVPFCCTILLAEEIVCILLEWVLCWVWGEGERSEVLREPELSKG